MANLVNVTPVMTSDNTPNPYVVSSDFEWLSSQPLWYVFKEGVYYAQKSDCIAGTPVNIKLDFGNETSISNFSIEMPTPSQVASIKLQGSNDGINWINIFEDDAPLFDGSIPVYTKDLNIIKTYRYLNIWLNPTGNYLYIRNIFYKLDTDLITNKILTINKTLRANLPLKIDLIKDEIHFTEDGGIYINDTNGNLKQCGELTSEILFKGRAVTKDKTYILTNSIENYDFLCVWIYAIDSSSNNELFGTTIFIDVKDIEYGLLGQFGTDVASNTPNRFVIFSFVNSTSFKYDAFNKTSVDSGISISKIIGFKL